MERLCRPNGLVDAPYGTLCTVMTEDGIEYYLQTSEDGSPEWIELGKILVSNTFKSFKGKTLTAYIDEHLKKYKKFQE